MGSVLTDQDRGADLDPVEDLNHVVIEHADASETHGRTQPDPVRPCRAVNGIFARADLHVGHVANADWILRPRGNDLALLVINRSRIHLGHGELSGDRG